MRILVIFTTFLCFNVFGLPHEANRKFGCAEKVVLNIFARQEKKREPSW